MPDTMIYHETDINGRTAVIIADSEMLWSTWADEWESARARHDIGDAEGYASACQDCVYLAESDPAAHAALLDDCEMYEPTIRTWNWVLPALTIGGAA